MTDRTHIVVLVDRSGSMANVAEGFSESINKFIAEQKTVPGKAWLTLADFDRNHAEPVPCIRIDGVKLADAPEDYTLMARGSTPLLDAMGGLIQLLTLQLAEKKNPRRVIFMVVTDGQENASWEFTSESLSALVNQKMSDGWDFMYMGAGLDAFGRRAQMAQAMGTGVPVANSVSMSQTDAAYASAMGNTSAAVTRSRLTGDRAEYTDEEREAISNS